MSQPIPIAVCKSQLTEIHSKLEEIEKNVFKYVLNELANQNPGRNRNKCDAIFTYYTQAYLAPCISSYLASRVAWVGGYALERQVLELEQTMKTEFHKGVLFHDTAIALLVSGNEAGYEYFIAMTDEEEARTDAPNHPRGTMNLRSGGLAEQTIIPRMQFAADLLNGNVARHAASFNFLTGRAPITATQFHAWRQTLEPLHQFELLRILHDIEVFTGYFSDYKPVLDNPFVMLRLAKGLSHLAQWVESCLTKWQGPGGPRTLGPKLSQDVDFGAVLVAAAGANGFPGPNLDGAALGAGLKALLTQMPAAPAGDQRYWRLLTILYLVRNSTAHNIEPGLDIYKNHGLLLELLQTVFLSVFVISQLKTKPMP